MKRPIFKLLSGAGVSGQNHHMAIFDKWNEFELRPICRRKFPNTADKSVLFEKMRSGSGSCFEKGFNRASSAAASARMGTVASANAVPASVGTSPFPVRVKSCAPMPSSSFRRRRLTAEVVKCADSPLADKLRVRMRIKRRRRSESS